MAVQQTLETDRAESAKPDRQRRSFYLDGALVDRLDATYRRLNHELYPADVAKSLFLETLIEFGLDNVDTLQQRLSEEVS